MMKNSEKIWNLLQSPNTFEMGMELLETMVEIDPEIPYELFTEHNALEWFQDHKNVRFPQLILDGFLSIWESGDEAYADCLTDIHSLSLVNVRQISQGHLDLFQSMPNLTLSVDWKGWLELSKKLPSTLVVDTLRLNCEECVVSMVDLLIQVECTHLEVEYPPKSIRVIGDCLAAMPKLQTLRCGVGEGVLIWLYRNKDLVHPVQTIQTGREMLTFAETDGTLQERVSSTKVSACVADEPEYNATIYPNLEDFIVGDVLGDMVSFVRAHKDIPSMTVRQVYMKGINHYLYDVANRYGIEFGRSTSRPLEVLPVLLYGVLPVMKSVRAKIDVPLEIHRRLMKLELTLNVYNIEKMIKFGKLSHRRLWDTVSLRVFFRQVLVLLRLGATLSVSSLKTLHNALVNLTLRDHLDLLDLLLSFEEFGVYDVESSHEQTLISRLLQTHFSEGLTFEKAMSRFPNKQHIDSYKLWWKEWQSLSVQSSSIKHLEAMEKLGLSSELLDDAVLQLINQSERSKHTVEWLLVRIQDMLERGDVTLQKAEQLMDRALDGFEDTISLTAIRLDTNEVSQSTAEMMLSLLLKHQLSCAPTEFKHVIDRENEGASRLYGDWVVQQFTNLNELTDSHLRHIIGRLMKVLMVSNQSVEDQIKVLQQHFDSSHDIRWLYQPWAYRRSLQKFDAIMGEHGDEWVLNGVTGLFDRRKYLIRSVEQRVSRMVSKGLWTEADRDAFLCKQAATSKKISRYVSTNFKISLFYALCRTQPAINDNKLNRLLGIAEAYQLNPVQFDAAVFQSKELLTKVKIAERARQLYQQNAWSQMDYQQALLESLKRIDYFWRARSHLPSELLKDLLDAIEVFQPQLSTQRLQDLFELVQKHSLDASLLDASLRSVKDFFATWSVEYLCERVLTLVQRGEWSQEEYNTWLLTNFEQSSYISSYKQLPQKIYKDLFGVLAACDVEISAHKFNTLLKFGQKHSLDASLLDASLRSMKDFFATLSAEYLCERVLTLVQQGEWSQEEYNTWLLANYHHKFTYSAWNHYDKQVYVDLFRCLMTVNDHDAVKLSVLERIQQRYELDFAVIKHVLRNTSNAFQTPDRSLVNLVEKWRADQTIDSTDFDALLQKSLPTLEYHSIIPDTWYERVLELLDQDDSRVVDSQLLGQLTQVLLKLGRYSTTVDRSILAISKNEYVSRLAHEIVPRYLLQRYGQGVSLDVPEYLWFACRKPTDDEVLQMVQYHQQGWTLFPTPHILQHMVHQIPSTRAGETYLQDCVAYWCQETGKAWFEGWTMEQLLIGLRAVPKDIPQLDILGTQMEVLPSECTRFTQLQKLFLYNTGLSTIPQAMPLSAVKVLSISNTSLEPSQVLNLPSLKTLYCKNVSVSEEHQGQFQANGVELRF